MKTPVYTRQAIDRWRLANKEKHLQQARESAKRYYAKVAEYKAIVRKFGLIDLAFFD